MSQRQIGERRDSVEWDVFTLDTERNRPISGRRLEFKSPKPTVRLESDDSGPVDTKFRYPKKEKAREEDNVLGWTEKASVRSFSDSGNERNRSESELEEAGQKWTKLDWSDMPRNEELTPRRKGSGFEPTDRPVSQLRDRRAGTTVVTRDRFRSGWGFTEPRPTRTVSSQPHTSSNDIKLNVRTPRNSAKAEDKDRKDDRPVPGDLEVLKDVNYLVIRQLVSMDILGGCGRENSYSVFKKDGGQILYVSEDSNCACRWFCGPNRWFRMTMFDPQEIPVLHVERAGCRCDWFCCTDACCCLHRMDVMDGKGRPLGVIREKFNVFRTRYEITTADDDVVAKLRGPCCECRCCYDMSFTILNKTGEKEIGTIRKMFGGRDKDGLNIDHELFELEYASFISNQNKALILGATLLMIVSNFEMS